MALYKAIHKHKGLLWGALYEKYFSELLLQNLRVDEHHRVWHIAWDTGRQKIFKSLLLQPQSVCRVGCFHIWILAVRLIELVFGASRYGWTMEMLELARHLILRHNILTEEVQGLQSWYVTFHNLIHLLEDVERFSSPDNYWCFSFERAMNMLRDHLTRILKTPLQGLRVKGSSSSSSENRTSQERWLMTYLQKC